MASVRPGSPSALPSQTTGLLGGVDKAAGDPAEVLGAMRWLGDRDARLGDSVGLGFTGPAQTCSAWSRASPREPGEDARGDPGW